MEFKFSLKDKQKAIKKRYKKEKKWKVLRITEKLSYIATVIMPIFIYNLFVELWERRIFYEVDIYTGEERASDPGMWALGAFLAMLGVIAIIKALKFNLTSSRIFSVRDEKLFEKDGKLYHIYKTQLGGGINTFRTGDEMVVEEIILKSIRELAINSKSGRVEFIADTKKCIYADSSIQSLAEQPRIISSHKHVFYDFFTPSLIEYLKAQGIPWEEQEIQYSIRLGG